MFSEKDSPPIAQADGKPEAKMLPIAPATHATTGPGAESSNLQQGVPANPNALVSQHAYPMQDAIPCAVPYAVPCPVSGKLYMIRDAETGKFIVTRMGILSVISHAEMLRDIGIVSCLWLCDEKSKGFFTFQNMMAGNYIELARASVPFPGATEVNLYWCYPDCGGRKWEFLPS